MPPFVPGPKKDKERVVPEIKDFPAPDVEVLVEKTRLIVTLNLPLEKEHVEYYLARRSLLIRSKNPDVAVSKLVAFQPGHEVVRGSEQLSCRNGVVEFVIDREQDPDFQPVPAS